MAIGPVKSENRGPTYRTLGVKKLCYEDGSGCKTACIGLNCADALCIGA